MGREALPRFLESPSRLEPFSFCVIVPPVTTSAIAITPSQAASGIVGPVQAGQPAQGVGVSIYGAMAAAIAALKASTPPGAIVFGASLSAVTAPLYGALVSAVQAWNGSGLMMGSIRDLVCA